MGVEQTEIDALATLRPELLRQVARDAIAPFYDRAWSRVERRARNGWTRRPGIIDDNLDTERWAGSAPRQPRSSKRCGTRSTPVNEALRVDVDDFDLPEIEIPEAGPTQGLGPRPLFDSAWSFAEQCQR